MNLDKEPYVATSSVQLENDAAVVYRSGNVVTLMLNGAHCNYDGSGIWLPEGYIPLTRICQPAMLIRASDGAMSIGYVTIGTNGGASVVGIANNTYTFFEATVHAEITFCV